jgi:hypothetical protein
VACGVLDVAAHADLHAAHHARPEVSMIPREPLRQVLVRWCRVPLAVAALAPPREPLHPGPTYTRCEVLSRGSQFAQDASARAARS